MYTVVHLVVEGLMLCEVVSEAHGGCSLEPFHLGCWSCGDRKSSSRSSFPNKRSRMQRPSTQIAVRHRSVGLPVHRAGLTQLSTNMVAVLVDVTLLTGMAFCETS